MRSVAETTARELFRPLGPTYDRYARLLSFGQDPRWRRFLVSRVPPAATRILDVATGTAAVAIELVRAVPGRTVVGIDQSPEMLAVARERARGLPIELVEGRAESLPFADGAFDALTFTYLLRYVDDPAATMRELARVVRPGGVIAMQEFGLPRGPWRPLWELYVRAGLPLAGAAVSPGWREVGSFLGPSIRGFHERHSVAELFGGLTDVHVRPMSLGGGLVAWGTT
ncbi:MAG: class I SAM-dependent methyltransferase [Acidobacteriota bacterium]|nr:class I SAM-dependent methyltransferase [Acidobacteriota bacterium]